AVPSCVPAQTAVMFCGQEFSGDGFLPADLDCTGFTSNSGAAVVILDHGALDLQGHTLTGGMAGARCPAPVPPSPPARLNDRTCEVSNGTIDGPTGYGVAGATVMTLSDLTIMNATDGVEGDRINLTGVTITNARDGIIGEHVNLVHSTISGSTGSGIWAST